MDFVLLNNQRANLTFARRLYESAFPPEERRDFDLLVPMVEAQKLKFWVVYNENQPIGIISIWDFQGVGYVEHFAIDEELRGRRYGEEIFKEIYARYSGRILLEVELPETEMQKRRIYFYERLGMKTVDYPYEQPPYKEGGKSLPLLLMLGKKMKVNAGLLDSLVGELHAQVYKKK